MISIITAIHNGLAVNKLYWAYLKKYTHHPFELIVIDNCSNDGSTEFFRSVGATVIENKQNYSYPYCQNQGIKAAKYEIYAFLNNDIIVSPQWDKRLLEIAEANGLEVITSCGIERVESAQATQKLKRKWKRTKNFLSLFGNSTGMFSFMHRMMYGNWEGFNTERYRRFGNQVIEGFVGNTVLVRKSAIEKIGLWDERIQAADFDLYVRAKKRNLEKGDLQPVHIALGVFNHHFIRVTVRANPPPFADKDRMISLEEKWGKDDLKKYLVDNLNI